MPTLSLDGTPEFKAKAAQLLYAQKYVQAKPWAAGGNAEPYFYLSHPSVLFADTDAAAKEYAEYLVEQGIFVKPHTVLENTVATITDQIKTAIPNVGKTPVIMAFVLLAAIVFIREKKL